MAICGKCGTQLSDGAKFCPNCGTQVTQKSEMAKQVNNDNNDEGLSKAQKYTLGATCFIAFIGLLGSAGNGEFFSVFLTLGVLAAVISVFIGKIEKKHAWLIALGGILVTFIAIGIAGPEENESDNQKQEVNVDENKKEQAPIIENKEMKPKVFFENGYKYSTSFRVRRNEGYGISCNYKYIIKIFKDGTKEISCVNQTDDGSPATQGTYSCSIDKKSGSYRDVAATWYEVKYKSSTSWGGKVHSGVSTIYIDEEGNVIMLYENGNNKDIYEAIATKDCRYGKLKKEILTKDVFRCKTCGKEYDPGKEALYSEEYCYNDYPQTCNSCGKTYTINTDGSYACKGTCSNCSEKHRNARLYREVTGRDY